MTLQMGSPEWHKKFNENIKKMCEKHRAWQKDQEAKGQPTTALEAVKVALRQGGTNEGSVQTRNE